MRVFTILFSIYFLALALHPCSDGHDIAIDEKVKTFVTEHHDHDHDTSHDTCSPLCMCQCCNTPVIVKNTSESVVIWNHSYIDKGNITFTGVIFNSAFYDNIWQPPRNV